VDSLETEGVGVEVRDDIDLADRMRESREAILTEVGKQIVGQQDVLEQVLLSLFVGGNSLLLGVPGLAKTMIVHTMAQVLDLEFSRIQFTPDLMPSDITGTEILQEDMSTHRRDLVFRPGPIFANIVLADEINRTPPKTQAALLEAMQEHRVTVQGTTYELEEPFFVFATQNPIELEGTYPLPEAQLDRFMFEVVIDHLPEEEELAVVTSTTGVRRDPPKRVVTREELLSFQQLVRRVPISEPVARYALSIVRASRPGANGTRDFVRDWVAYGASVRAAQFMVLGGKARALTRGRFAVSYEDIREMALPILRHRILTNFQAQSEGITTDRVVQLLLESVPMPKSGM
jgi:MoxR-like ATPase